ncbi:hypothetical protein [Thioalkalivibrio thiocyanodenitrificans]|uniref:hypothetical protein n=1 Tax=Thioalkalivibrio thiocyanodenitrificans TaxID=243063 RepID=UPI000365BCC0|nr:hypothetical protein [Thioalkalivibrio thiocyanodenitrificans]
MQVSRASIAVVIGLLIALAVVVPLVWLINTRDWGVALMLLAPFIVYGLIRMARMLAEWADPPPELPTRTPKGGPSSDR